MIAVLFVSIAALSGCGAETDGNDPGSEARDGGGGGRPNVLILITEDQGAQLGLLGTSGIETPHMDELARSGVYFRSAFVSYPVCSASKAGIYTGLYGHLNGLMGNTVDHFKPAADVSVEERRSDFFRGHAGNRIHDTYPTLVEILREAGYYTGVARKLMVLPNEKFPYDEYLTRKIDDQEILVETFIQRAKAAGKPWFLFRTIGPPHRPFPNSDVAASDVDPREVVKLQIQPDTLS